MKLFKKKIDIKSNDDNNVHEFMWCNTESNITAQGNYIGIEHIDGLIAFYLVNPNKSDLKCIQSYQLNANIYECINDTWIHYTETPEKDKILILSPFAKAHRVFTNTFVYNNGNKYKILEITMPFVYLNNEIKSVRLD